MDHTLTEEEISAFVGAKEQYYLIQWKPALPGGRPGSGFNFAAAFLSGLWLPYRKMFIPALALHGILIAISVIGELVFVFILGFPESPPFVNLLVAIAAGVICGVFGNRWYLRHAVNASSRFRAQGLDGVEYLDAMSRKGGTSVLAAIGFNVGSMIVGGMIVAAMYFVHAFAGGLQAGINSVTEAGTVTPVVLGQPVTDNIDAFTDSDAFSFEAVEGQGYVITVVGVEDESGLADTMLTLWDSDGTTALEGNDDYGGTLNSRLEWVAPRTDTFYVVVENADFFSTGDYTLTVELEKP